MVAAKWAGLKHGGDRKSDEIKSPIGGLNQTATKTRDEAAWIDLDASPITCHGPHAVAQTAARIEPREVMAPERREIEHRDNGDAVDLRESFPGGRFLRTAHGITVFRYQ